MKKGLIFLLGIMSFLGINTVSAKEIYFEYDTNINSIRPYIDEIGYETLNNAINENIKYYNDNLSNDYPYYFISIIKPRTTDIANEIDLVVSLTALSDINTDNYLFYFSQSGSSSYLLSSSLQVKKQIYYNYKSNRVFDLDSSSYGIISYFDLYSDYNRFNPYNYYYSNFNLLYKGSLFNNETDIGSWDLTYLNPEDNLYFPYFDNPDKYTSHPANIDFLIEPYYLHDNNESLQSENYTTINLNDYAYVILSLKDYTPRDTFTTTMYIKGQLCPTTVYNYGTEEKKDYISGWQNQDCGTYYDSYTRHLNYIRSEDITNHAVYYLTGYDSTKENLVKVDSTVYNITYITEENRDNPEVNIGGKNYSTLPYDKLTDTAIKTEQNGVNNTWTCAKYDTDCFMDSSGVNIDTLFSNPIETLKTVWGAITSIFSLIAEFILLLPPTMQAFLYLAFGVGVALGIIKILV